MDVTVVIVVSETVPTVDIMKCCYSVLHRLQTKLSYKITIQRTAVMNHVLC